VIVPLSHSIAGDRGCQRLAMQEWTDTQDLAL